MADVIPLGHMEGHPVVPGISVDVRQQQGDVVRLLTTSLSMGLQEEPHRVKGVQFVQGSQRTTRQSAGALLSTRNTLLFLTLFSSRPFFTDIQADSTMYQ